MMIFFGYFGILKRCVVKFSFELNYFSISNISIEISILNLKNKKEFLDKHFCIQEKVELDN